LRNIAEGRKAATPLEIAGIGQVAVGEGMGSLFSHKAPRKAPKAAVEEFAAEGQQRTEGKDVAVVQGPQEPMFDRFGKGGIPASVRLDFVALYGLVLIPMGGIIFADFYLLRKWNLQDYYAEKMGINFNWAAGITWFSLLGIALVMNMWVGIELYFLPLPVWVLSILFFMIFSKLYQKKIAA